jgi:hypothetical protein
VPKTGKGKEKGIHEPESLEAWRNGPDTVGIQVTPANSRRRYLQATQEPARASNAVRLKPRAQKVLEFLRSGPKLNWRVMEIGGLGWASRIGELRNAGYEISCRALGPTKGARTYKLEGRK